MYGRLSETGGVSSIASLVDRQIGPTCGFEAVETVVQLHYPARDDISRTLLQPLAARGGFLVRSRDGYGLAIHGIYPLLTAVGIACDWYAFEHQTLVDALQEDRVGIVVLDAHLIDPGAYPERNSWHAIVLTNFVLDSERQAIAYVGADSNFPHQERWWSYDNVRLAAQACAPFPLLLTRRAVNWLGRADHYRVNALGQVVASPRTM